MSIDALVELADDFAKTKKSFMDRAREKLTPALLSVFDKHPELVAMGWTQYTPYFNDGDTCEFGVGELNATTDEDQIGKNFWDWEYSDGCYNGDDESRWVSIEATLDNLNKTLQQNYDLLQEVFGDHVKVIVTKNGIEVEGYHHD